MAGPAPFIRHPRRGALSRPYAGPFGGRPFAFPDRTFRRNPHRCAGCRQSADPHAAGHWLTIHASHLTGMTVPPGTVGVTIQRAPPADVAALVFHAHGLAVANAS